MSGTSSLPSSPTIRKPGKLRAVPMRGSSS
jgi:hypothetical protein